MKIILKLINDYDGDKTTKTKELICDISTHDIEEIKEYIRNKYELNLCDMWIITDIIINEDGEWKAYFITTQSDLLKYNGLECEVIRELDEDEYDKEDLGYLMYEVGFHIDGFPTTITIDAYEDEIIRIKK